MIHQCCPFFSNVLLIGLRYFYICCQFMLTVQKFNRTVFGIHVNCPGVRTEKGWWRREQLQKDSRAPVWSSQAQARGRASPRPECRPRPSPSSQCPGLCLWGPLMPTAKPTAPASSAVVPPTAEGISPATHSGKKLGYLLNNVRFSWDHCIIGLNPGPGKSAHSTTTPRPRNSCHKRILNTFFLFVLTMIHTSVNAFKW